MDELHQAITAYKAKWDALVKGLKDPAVLESLQPTAIGWKTEDIADFDTRLTALRGHADHIHLGRINERWLATIHLRDTTLAWGMVIIKLMQRRPGSSDAVGLDHVDFLLDGKTDVKPLLASEPSLSWTEEKNGEHCKWISVWFDDTEAKLRSDTVLDVCIAELQDSNRQIRPRPVE